MRKWLPLIVLLALAGCGSKEVKEPGAVTTTTTCHPRNPPAMGDAIRCRYPQKVGATLPTASRNPQGQDWSQWQGVSPSTAGLSFVIIQANAGFFVNPYLGFQITDANAHHIPWGAYTFLEPGVSGASEASKANSLTAGRGRSLGLWGDAEVNGAYSQACPYASEARALGVNVYGIYSSPGLWPGGRCPGYLWAAIWGGPVYSFGGYPLSSVIVRQWSGYGIDKDESLGLLKPSPKPKPKPPVHPSPSRAKALEHQINLLRVLIRKHRCQVPPKHGGGKFHRPCSIWVRQGQADHRALR